MSNFSVNHIFKKKNINLISLMMILKKLLNFIYLEMFFVKKINLKLNFIKQKVIVYNLKNIFLLDKKLFFLTKI
tara:strand:+ start:1074 stop:1295 length:222 start_codon:yes stop_codon:yes gene_type:complete